MGGRGSTGKTRLFCCSSPRYHGLEYKVKVLGPAYVGGDRLDGRTDLIAGRTFDLELHPGTNSRSRSAARRVREAQKIGDGTVSGIILLDMKLSIGRDSRKAGIARLYMKKSTVVNEPASVYDPSPPNWKRDAVSVGASELTM